MLTSDEFDSYLINYLYNNETFVVAVVVCFQNTALHITFLSYDIPFTGKHEPNKLTCSQLCDFVAQLVRALHWHRRDHRFESR